MNRHIVNLIVFFLTALASCDGGDNAFFVNHTQDTVVITMKQTLKLNDWDTTSFKIKPLKLPLKHRRNDGKWKWLGDYEVVFDSSNNSATFKLPPKEMVELGQTWLKSRRYYDSWEFNELEIEFKDGKIIARNQGIPDMAERKRSWISNSSYHINIGQESMAVRFQESAIFFSIVNIVFNFVCAALLWLFAFLQKVNLKRFILITSILGGFVNFYVLYVWCFIYPSENLFSFLQIMGAWLVINIITFLSMRKKNKL